MTIQISVTVWTILCFAALYWILRKLLFEPVLEVMDRRRQKLEDVRETARKADAVKKEARQKRQAEQEALQEAARRRAAAEAETARIKGRSLLEEAKKERISYVDSFRSQVTEEYKQDMEHAGNSMQDIADRFLTRLFTNEL